MIFRRAFIAIVMALGVAFTAGAALARETADTIFSNGAILPMTGADDRAEALAVRDGRIVYVGSEQGVEALRGSATRTVDLAGRALLPGFIDAHGHITLLARYAAMAQLQPPPVGPVRDIGSLQAALAEHARSAPEGWIIGAGYDDAELAEARHPTRQELDAVSVDRPIVALHVSGHLAALNTRALEMVGMLRPGEDPPGGVIRREADGATASGVIEEAAMFAALGKLPQPPMDLQVEWLDKAQRIYAENGLTTAQDGATTREAWELLQEAARRGSLILDVHALPLVMMGWPGFEAIPFNRPYDRHLRAAGVKIVADGSPQGRTAWLSHPYHVPPEGRGADYAGYRQIPDEVFRATLRRAADNGWQAFVHVNGDASIQQLVKGVRAIAETGKPLDRTIAIHAQTARRDQLEAMKALDIEPSFFAAHTFFWGDWHREVTLGPLRGDRISPQRDAFEIGLTPSIHNDAPIVPPDIIRLVWSAATRRTRSGDILGPEQRVSVYQALEEVTRNAAYAIREEAEKGTLEPGKRADFVILDRDPLAMPAESLLDLKVAGTVKDGAFVFGSP